MVGNTNFDGNEAWIKNTTLFGANKVYLLAKNITYDFSNLISHKPTTKVDITIQSGETNIGDATNYNRRKGQNSYDGFNAIHISVTGVIDVNNLGTMPSGEFTITPGLLYTMLANGNQTYNFFDERIGSSWVADPDPMNTVQKPYNSTDGIPVVLLSHSIVAGESRNVLNYTLNFREDKT